MAFETIERTINTLIVTQLTSKKYKNLTAMLAMSDYSTLAKGMIVDKCVYYDNDKSTAYLFLDVIDKTKYSSESHHKLTLRNMLNIFDEDEDILILKPRKIDMSDADLSLCQPLNEFIRGYERKIENLYATYNWSGETEYNILQPPCTN